MDPALKGLEYHLLGEDGLDLVQPLWQQLRTYHERFFESLPDPTPKHEFEPRKQALLAKAARGRLRIELVTTTPDRRRIAYSISSISPEGVGEVDSMFVADRYRGRGIGSELLRRSLAWLDDLGASSKLATVAHGNTAALAFYQRHGFQPRTVTLQQFPPGVAR